MDTRRIESSASRTADMTCGCRAISFCENDPLLKGSDWVAPMLLPASIQPFVRFGPTRSLLRRVMGPQGVYGWVISRTRYIDQALLLACDQGFSQVLIFGAGFDSRGVRFSSKLRGMRLFELDAPTTQEMKITQFRKRGVILPPNVFLIGINFEKELVEQKLEHYGFTVGGKTLVILEGVLQYLNSQAVEATFTSIRNVVGGGSRIVFDYAYAFVLRGEGNVFGQKRMIRGTSRVGESWQFGLDETEVEPFLQKHGFVLTDQKNPKELEDLNFRGADGRIRLTVNGTQGIATAERR